jgi:outer membrane receptor protein involved in Fe transport
VDVSAQVDLLAQRSGPLMLTGTLRVENVFDEAYVGAFGFPARGRTVYVGGRVTR